MAHDVRTRTRARVLYISGRSLDAIEKATRVSRATLQRWSAEERWKEARQMERDLAREATELALDMTRAARESSDPQQAYAAIQAARLAGLSDGPTINPPAGDVAKALIGAIAQHPEVGPVVRKHRKEIIELVMSKLEHLEAAL